MLVTSYVNIASTNSASMCIHSAPDSGRVPTANRLKRPIQSRAAHELLNALLKREGLDSPSMHLTHDADGRPLLYRGQEPCSIAVGLSHSRTIAACAITDLGAIGIDVEFCADRHFQGIAAAAFGPAEQALVAREGQCAFYRIWTLREALAKADGNGLARLTDGSDYFADAPGIGSWRAIIDGQDWMFWTGVVADKYAGSVAIAPRETLPAPDAAALAMRLFSD
ncbi:MAG: 4'-phosphopantetheinyl transferase superfamily protein [Candidatus Binataceae bacterium]|nr:4'-phosphopantetheinyl transferase superfamily protein [Candidatus Binataceae bacterium]